MYLYPVQKFGKTGYIDQNGNVRIDFAFDDGLIFTGSCTGVKIGSTWGIADVKGTIVAEPRWEAMRDFKEGRALVKLRRRWGYIARNGDEIVQPTLERAADFSEGLAAITAERNSVSFIDTAGEVVIGPFHQVSGSSFSEGLALLSSLQSFRYLDKEGRCALTLPFLGSAKSSTSKDKTSAGSFRDGLAPVSDRNRKYGFIDKSGEAVVEYTFELASEFSEGLAAVCVNGKWGYINVQGEMQIVPKYDSAQAFTEGLATVEADGKLEVINNLGDPLFEVSLDGGIEPFLGGVAQVWCDFEDGRKIGYIDRNGAWIWPLTAEC